MLALISYLSLPFSVQPTVLQLAEVYERKNNGNNNDDDVKTTISCNKEMENYTLILFAISCARKIICAKYSSALIGAFRIHLDTRSDWVRSDNATNL